MMRQHIAVTCVATTCLAVAIVGGCATQRPDTTAFLGPDLPFRTPAPRDLGASVQVAQLITARYGGETYIFAAQLSVSSDQLTLICLDPFGRRALTIVSTGDEITTDAAPWLPRELKAENILADIAVVYWPAEAVRHGLRETKAVVSAQGQYRTITINDREVIRVDYDEPAGQTWPSSARYRNHAFGYELVLQSAAVSQ